MPTDEALMARYIRALRTLSAGNYILLHGSNEENLLEEMCRVIVEKGGYTASTVGYAEWDAGKSIQWVAAVGGVDKQLLQSLNYTWDQESRSVTGMAIRTGKPCIARDVLTDAEYIGPDFGPLRSRAENAGWAAVSAFPLCVDDVVIGALGMAAPEADAFDPDEVSLLSELAANLAYGIENLRIKKKHLESERLITRLAYYDELTGLPNRTQFHEKTKDAIALSQQRQQSFALLSLQLNQFHEVNDILGYEAGDHLLRTVADRLVRAGGEHELRARVGETEFAVLVEHVGASLAIKAAKHITDLLNEPIEVHGFTVHLLTKIGIALFPGHGMEAEALMRRANSAARSVDLSHANYAVYAGGLEQENTKQLALMSDLRNAIAREELFLYCQPRVVMATREIAGVELFVRWKHPSHGWLSTAEFNKIAERAALVTPLTNWVLEEAFSRAYAWLEEGKSCPVSICLFAHDLRDSALVNRIRGLFSTWGLPSALIQFEITEDALMDAPERALQTLQELREMNLELYIDKYGTGYSSLRYLQQLPVGWIKIDPSFVAAMKDCHDATIIVRSTIDLGHNLGRKVVAEGVADPGTWEKLLALGCDVVQGDLLTTPIPIDEFQAWRGSWIANSA